MNYRQSIVEAGLRADRPSYVYDLEELRRQCARLEQLDLDASYFFATMANDHPAILEAVRSRGHGVFVNSPRHLGLAQQVGFAASKIVYAASNMLPEEMQACRRQGVNLILDSLDQLRTFAGLAGRGADVALRLSVGSALEGNEIRDNPTYRFGLLPSELPAAVRLASQGGVRIVGAHSYFGTDVMAPSVLLDGLARLASAAEQLPDLEFLDAGGGFGVSEDLGGEFDLAAYARGATELLHRVQKRLGRRLKLLLEPGRWLVAKCGYFFARVVDVKHRPDRVFVGTNGSVAIFPRPLIYPGRAAHPCELIGAAPDAAVHPEPIYVCGNSTYSRDFLASNVKMPLPRPDDALIFHKAGAYCRSMMTDFLGKDRPEEIVLNGTA
jgi:diaminopimelate decarboxylase